MLKHPKPQVAIPAAFIIVAVFVVALALLILMQSYQAISLRTKPFPSGPAVYYTVDTFSDPQTSTNHTLTSKIYRSTVDGDQVAIAVLQETADNAPVITVMPDDSALILAYKNQVYSLNPHTAQRRLLYTAVYQILGTAVSPDKQSLFIWDSDASAIGDHQAYQALRYSFNQHSVSLLGKGIFNPGTGFTVDSWVQDDLVTLNESTKDYTSERWHYNPITNALTDVGIRQPFYAATPADDHVAVPGTPSAQAAAICTDPFAIAPSSYTVKDEAGKETGMFSLPGKQVEIGSIFTDGTLALATAYDLPTSANDCGLKKNLTYYILSADGSAPQKVTDYNQQLTTWSLPVSPSVTATGGNIYKVYYGQKLLFTVPVGEHQEVHVVGAVN